MFLTKNKTEGWKLSLPKNAKNGVKPDDGSYKERYGTGQNGTRTEQNLMMVLRLRTVRNGTEWNKNRTRTEQNLMVVLRLRTGRNGTRTVQLENKGMRIERSS